MFHPTLFENSRPDGFPVLEVAEEAVNGSLPPRRFVPLQRTELTGEVVGPLAQLRLVQTFGFTRAQHERPLEALYRFPLPGDAAVTAAAIQFGETRIEAHLAAREQAEAEYAAAKREGRQAALATRESPDVFTLRVTGIRPDEEVTVETLYVQAARPADGARWSLRVPLTTAPRYVRIDEAGDRSAAGQPLALLRDPGHRFTLDLRLPGASDIRSDTHRLEVTTEEAVDGSGESDGLEPPQRRVRLADGSVIPDRDLVLVWRPDSGGAAPPAETAPRLQVWVHDAPVEADETEETYFLAQIAPPRRRELSDTVSGVGREVILLVDHSGSMEGAKWAAADWAVARFLSGLTERDTLAIGLFHNTTRWLDKRPQAATAKAVQAVEQFLRAHRDSGGTELGIALEQALALPRDERDQNSGASARPPRTRHLLIVTDAEVSDAGRILRLADKEASRTDPWQRRRISVLCIDAAPNALLAHELAERGGGVARFLTSDPAEEDITTALDALLEDWAEPIYAHLRLTVNRPGAETAAGHGVVTDIRDANAAEKTFLDLGDLPGGRVIFVAGRVPRRASGADADLTFRATLSDGREITGPVRFPPARRERAASEHTGLKALFGARRVLGLERLITAGYTGDDLADRLRRLGYDPAAALAGGRSQQGALYPENRETDASAALKALLVRESLHYGIASSETAFVATRTERGQPVTETMAVANALPAGWQDEDEKDTRQKLRKAQMPSAASPPPTPGQAMSQTRDVLEHLDLSEMAEPALSAAPFVDVDLQRAAAPKSAEKSLASRLFGGAVNLKRARKPDSDGGMVAGRPASIVGKEEARPEPRSAGDEPLFQGVPVFVDGAAVLYDSDAPGAAARMPDGEMLTRLEVRFPKGAPDSGALGPGVVLLLYVDDLATPRARVRLSDLLRQGGVRPLNLRRQPGQRVRLILADEDGVWATGQAPEMTVTLV